MEAAPPRTVALIILALASIVSSCGGGTDPFRPPPAPPEAQVTPAPTPTPAPPVPTTVAVPEDTTAHLRWARLELNGVAMLVPIGPQPGHGSPWMVEHYVDPCRGAPWPYTIVRVYTNAVMLRFDWPEARFRVLGQPPTRDETRAVVHMLGSVRGTWAGTAHDIASPAPTPVGCAAWDGFGPPPN